MADDKEEKKGSPKINPPDVYDGKQEELPSILATSQTIHGSIPKNFGEDNQKIAFVLSYLRKGDADSWEESFQTQKSTGKKPEDALDLGTWTQFAKDLEDAFKSEYAEQDAISDLNKLVMT